MTRIPCPGPHWVLAPQTLLCSPDLGAGGGITCPHGSLCPQAIQHIEGTQERLEQEEEQRRAVIVKPVRSCPEAQASDTASDSETSDSDAMDQSREEPAGLGGFP